MFFFFRYSHFKICLESFAAINTCNSKSVNLSVQMHAQMR